MTTSVRLHRRTCAFERQDVGNHDSVAPLMDANAARHGAGEAQSTTLEALDQVFTRRTLAEKRQLRFVAGFAAATGAIISTGAFIGGLAPAVVILLSVLPGAFVGYTLARSSRRRSREAFQEEQQQLSDHAALGAQRTSPSPRVAEILRGMLVATKSDLR